MNCPQIIKPPILVLGLLMLSFTTCAQQESCWWYFGKKGQLNFTKAGVKGDTNGVINTLEGCSSISHRITGEKLFYTDGITVWDSTHSEMPNGKGLLGHESSSQTALIVPMHWNKFLYYIFTIDDGAINKGKNGLRYSIVDMRLNGGKGDIDTTKKNITLMVSAGERLTAVEHHNLYSIWIIAQKYGSNEYYSFEITSTGINSPVISRVGPNPMNIPFFPKEMHLGCLKVDPMGQHVAFTYSGLSSLTLADFNNKNGVISNGRTSYLAKNSLPYGVEFSPNGNLLYLSLYEEIRQFDVKVPASSFSRNRGITILKTKRVTYGALQQAKNRKIYISALHLPSVTVINAPNNRGVSCNVQYAAQPLDTGTCIAGLPAFVQSYFAPTYFKLNNSCVNLPVRIMLKDTTQYDSIYYNYGDIASGILNSSKNRLDSHIYKKTGKYTVTAYGYFNYRSRLIIDTFVQVITIENLPIINLRNDTVLCNRPLTFQMYKGKNYSYKWHNGTTKSSFLLTKSGKVWIEVTNECGVKSDTMNVVMENPVTVKLGRDTILCEKSSLRLKAVGNSLVYKWSTGVVDSGIVINKGGTYSVSVSNTCNTATDSIVVMDVKYPEIVLPKDIISCFDSPKEIKGTYQNIDNFLWSNGDTNSSIYVKKEGWYSLAASNKCGIKKDSILIRIHYAQDFDLGEDTFFCNESEVHVNLKLRGKVGSIYWNSVLVNDTNFIVSKSGIYRVTTKNLCGEHSDEINIDQLFTPKVYLGKDTVLCAGEQITFSHFKPEANKYNSYFWSGIVRNGDLAIPQSGQYWLKIKNPCGLAVDTINIEEVDVPYFGIRDTMRCEDESLEYNFSDFKELTFVWNKTENEYVHTITDYEKQMLWIKNEFGCLGVERFEISRCPNPLFAPNAFSPNFDGINETFRVYIKDIYYFEIEVYDRWNKTVFSTNKIENGWDGTVFNNGENVCPQGQYIWKLKYREKENNQLQIEIGEVQLVR